MDAGDSARVLEWRNSERIRKAMYTDHVISPEEHALWMERILRSERDDYNIFEHRGEPLGLASANDIRKDDGVCSWGYYVGSGAAPKGAGVAMEWLMLDRLFGTLRMRKVCAEVFRFNEASLRFLKRFHFEEEGELHAHRLKAGRYEDVVLLALFSDTWFSCKDELAASTFSGETR